MTFPDPRQARFLQEMGIDPLWTLRTRTAEHGDGVTDAAAVTAATPAPAPASQTAQPAQPHEEMQPVFVPQPAAEDAKAGLAPAETAPAAEPQRANATECDDDLPDWVTEGMPLELDMPFDSAEESDTDPGKTPAQAIARMDWDALESAVSVCTKCRLCEGRTRTVFGVGDRQAKWLFVGEGPGYNEDLQGEPFVGPAGKLLDNILAAMGLHRGENAYIANVVKCRPSGDNGRDRPPAPDEAAACLPYLQRQIDLIQPEMIVALGKSAALALLQAAPDTPVTRLRNQVHRYRDIPLVVTYHPAYLLRSPEEKAKVWRDLCLAMATRDNAAAVR